MNRSKYHRQRGNVEKAEELRKQAQTLSSRDANDPEYRRLKYVRYADDFLLGFNGPKSEAEEIKQALRDFLRDELKLELSEEKTLITHAKSQAARFLGYEVTTIQDDPKRLITKKGRDRRSLNGKIGLRVPKDVRETKCKSYMRKGHPMHRATLLQENDFTIITTYQLEFRGIAEYYRLAYNMGTLNKLKWVMEYSLLKTLANKFRMPLPRVVKKYRAETVVDGKKYKVLQVRISRQEKKPLVATWGGVSLSWDSKATLAEQPLTVKRGNHSELVQRLLAGDCELCGATEKPSNGRRCPSVERVMRTSHRDAL